MTAVRPLRLLWLVDSLGAGGAEALSVPFARALDRREFELTVAAMHGAEGINAERLRAAGVTVVDLHARSLRDLGAFRRLLRLVRESEIDLIHAHLAYSAIWSAIVRRLTGVPAIASLHVTPAATRALHASLRHRVSTDLRDRLMKALANRWLRRVITVSAALAEEYASHGLDRAKVEVVHNGIETTRFHRNKAEVRARLEREFDIPANAPLVVTVSVLRPVKGIEVLIDAIAPIPDAVFLVIGDGPMREEWTARATHRGVAGRIRWAGFRNDVDELLAGADLMVHPSLDEALPTVLLEAMAAGLPVVATRVGGVPEIVEPGVTGELVNAGDPVALSAAVTAILSDRSNLESMRVAALANASRFSTVAWVERLTTLYRTVLREPLRHDQRIAVRA